MLESEGVASELEEGNNELSRAVMKRVEELWRLGREMKRALLQKTEIEREKEVSGEKRIRRRSR